MNSRRMVGIRVALVCAAVVVFAVAACAQELRFEAENLKVIPQIDATGPQPNIQQMGMFGNQWSNNAHLWFRATAPGQSFKLTLPVPEGKSYQLLAHFTRAPDYGIVQVSLDDKPAGAPFDAYAASVTRSDAIDLGTFDLAAGDHTLTFTVTGRNASSTSFMAGVDLIILRQPQLVVGASQPGQPTRPEKKPSALGSIGNVIGGILAAATQSVPDLQVAKFDPVHGEQLLAPFPPEGGGVASISVKFANVGKAPVTSPFFVDLFIDEQPVHRWTYGTAVDPLPLDPDKWVTFTHVAYYLPPGVRKIRAVVDAENQIAESDESRGSNWMEYKAEWVATPDLPDLVVDEIAPEGQLAAGEKQTWKVRVVNEGKTAIKNQSFLQITRSDGKVLAGTINPLPPQAFQNLFIEADPIYEPTTLKLAAVADYDYRVKEANEGNNSKDAIFELRSPDVPIQVAKLSFESTHQAGTPPTDAKRKFVARPIYPGSIPPTFVHTWQLALREMDSFKLHFSPLLGNPKIRFTWGDKLTVLDTTGKVLATFKSTDDVKNTVVKCQNAAVKEDDIANYTKLYLVLETSEVTGDRWMKLEGLSTTKTPTGNERVVVLEDEIDYSAPADAQFLVATDSQGAETTLYAPWWGDTTPTAGETGGAAAAYPKPNPAQGWYLIGSNLSSPFGMVTTTPSRSFYTLIYYNDVEGLLRVYLNNWEIPENLATGFIVEIGLLGRVGAGSSPPLKQLKGAFFPIDPSPENWSTARLVLRDWPIRTWRMIEIPMLYPTAEDLALANKTRGPNYAIYEEALRTGARNVRIQVSVTAFQQGTAKMSLEGEAIGDAVKGATPKDLVSSIQAVYDGIKQGKNWYDKASSFSKTVENNMATLTKLGVEELAKWAARGASCFAGPIGIAGAAVSILAEFLSGDPEPITMAIKLSLTGTIEGTTTVPGTPCKTWCYLPGRFSIQDAFQPLENLPKGDQKLIASRLPRYDRTMGLFGYAYNPGKVMVDVVREDFYDPLHIAEGRFPIQWIHASRLHVPEDMRSPVQPKDPPWKAAYGAQVKKTGVLLPIIYNPYVGIQPRGSDYPGAPASARNVVYGHEMERDYAYPSGKLISTYLWPFRRCCPFYMPAIPQTYAGFKDRTDCVYQNDTPMDCPDVPYPNRGLPDLAFVEYVHEAGFTEADFDKFDANLLYPLLNVIQICDFTYDRTLAGGQFITKTAHFSSPISVNLVRWLVDKNGEKPTKHKLYQVKSELMQNLTLKDLGQ